MSSFKQVDGKTGLGEHFRSAVLNEDATFAATMPVGTVVVMSLNGTDDGTAVVMPSTAGAAQTQAAAFGVLNAPAPYNTGALVYATRNGLCNAIITLQTRATTNSWASGASSAQWQVLTIDTVNNCLLTASASKGTFPYQPIAYLASSINSYTGSASATSDTRTVLTTLARVWVNML